MILLSHLLPSPFTEEIAVALQSTGQLSRFCTTLTPSGRDPLARLLAATGTGQQRRIDRLSRDRLATYPWREALRLAAGRTALSAKAEDRLFHWALHGFDQWVAGQLSPEITAVYAYETECLATFRAARARRLGTVYDLPSPEHDFVENLLEREYERFPDLDPAHRRYLRAQQAERTARRHEEFALATLAIANSSFTRETWMQAGLRGDKIVPLPYGAPAPDPRGADGGSRGQGPLHLVWAGTFSVRKGAHYLLEAWENWPGRRHAFLDVFGSVQTSAGRGRRLPEGIRLHGPVPRLRVLNEFLQADALVFPTLCDGFGLVVNEALSRGLPVVTTRRAGASELIRPGVNGLLIEAGDASALRTALDWCLDHRTQLRAMRAAALQTAAQWQWSDYRTRLLEILRPALA